MPGGQGVRDWSEMVDTGNVQVVAMSDTDSTMLDNPEKCFGQVQRSEGGYRLEATIPLSAVNLQQVLNGTTLQADFGIIYGDRKGTVNLARIYWSNQATGLVNDVPGETMLTPALWGTVNFKDSNSE